jgi:hypothetical protein
MKNKKKKKKKAMYNHRYEVQAWRGIVASNIAAVWCLG